MKTTWQRSCTTAASRSSSPPASSARQPKATWRLLVGRGAHFLEAVLQAAGRVLGGEVEHADLPCPEAQDLAAGAERQRHGLGQPGLADLGAAGDAGDPHAQYLVDEELDGRQLCRQQVGKGDDRTIERWRVAACADPRGIAAAFAGAAHEGDEAVVGAVEFLVGLRHGGRAARGVGAKEPLNRGAPAAVGAGARLGQGGGRGAVEQAADGGVGQLAGALAALWPGLLAKFMH